MTGLDYPSYLNPGLTGRLKNHDTGHNCSLALPTSFVVPQKITHDWSVIKKASSRLATMMKKICLDYFIQYAV